MAVETKKPDKRRWGDRRDGRRIKDAPGMQIIMANIMPNRTDAEVCLRDTIDATNLVAYLNKKNAEHPEYKTTVFHCTIVALARLLMERPLMNRFIQGRRLYERYDISIGFTAKRRFTDYAEESLMFFTPTETDTLDTLSQKIASEVQVMRKSEHSTGGIDALMDRLAKLPRPLLMLVGRVVRWLDFWGKNPKAITDGDPNYSSVYLTNLGSIKCPSVYHHLNNYGTQSFFVAIGTLHKDEITMPDGHREIRDVIDFSATLDERIGDGFYFARSLKLIKYIFAHPELLDRPLGEPSGFDYE